MKTYAETMGHKPIDWEKYLLAIVNDEELPEEIEDIEGKAADWETDPIANLSSEIPRDNGQWPLDCELRNLGVEFSTYIRLADYTQALETIAEIKKRGAKVLEEMERSENIITVEVRGRQASGKTVLLNKIKNMLSAEGYTIQELYPTEYEDRAIAHSDYNQINFQSTNRKEVNNV